MFNDQQSFVCCAKQLNVLGLAGSSIVRPANMEILSAILHIKNDAVKKIHYSVCLYFLPRGLKKAHDTLQPAAVRLNFAGLIFPKKWIYLWLNVRQSEHILPSSYISDARHILTSKNARFLMQKTENHTHFVMHNQGGI